MKTPKSTQKNLYATIEKYLRPTKVNDENRNLLLKNLLKTNLQLLKSVDISSSVLF